jgi:protein-disulfide isomerase
MRSPSLTLRIAAAAVAVALVATTAGCAVSAAQSSSSSDAASSSSAAPDLFARRDADDPRAIGSVDAPVVMTEFADFRCPYCAVFAEQDLPKLQQKYVETGKLRIEFHDMAIFGDQSERAAVATRTAAAQGRFWEYYDAVYAAAPPSGHPDLPDASLVAFAKTAGVPDLDRFRTDLGSADLLAKVRADTAAASQAGVNGTPFFVIGSQGLSGAQPLATFETFIDTQLKAAR